MALNRVQLSDGGGGGRAELEAANSAMRLVMACPPGP